MPAEKVAVTGALFAYNHAQYVAEALKAALAQTYRMQLIVIDDGSTDGTGEVIKTALREQRSHHDVVLINRTVNLGFARSINEAMTLAKGELIVEFAGDDISMPHRVERLVRELREIDGRSYALGSGYRAIDEQGQALRDVTSWVGTEWRTPDIIDGQHDCVLGASMAWRREVFDVFGPLPAENRLEDVAVCFRAGILGSIRFIPEVLLQYRLHAASGSREMWPVPRIDTLEDFRRSKRREAKELFFIIGHHDETSRKAREKQLLTGVAARKVERIIARYMARFRYFMAVAYGGRVAVLGAALRALATRGLRYDAFRAVLLALTWHRYADAIGLLRRCRQSVRRWSGRP